MYQHTDVWIRVVAMDRGQPKSRNSEPKRIRLEWGHRSASVESGKTTQMEMEFSRRRIMAEIWEDLPKGEAVAKVKKKNVNSSFWANIMPRD